MQRPSDRDGGEALRVCIGKTHTAPGKGINVGRLHPCVSIAAEFSGAKRVKDNDHDVRFYASHNSYVPVLS